MNLGQWEMAIHIPDLISELPEQSFDYGVRRSAMRAFEIAVFQKRNRCIVVT